MRNTTSWSNWSCVMIGIDLSACGAIDPRCMQWLAGEKSDTIREIEDCGKEWLEERRRNLFSKDIQLKSELLCVITFSCYVFFSSSDANREEYFQFYAATRYPIIKCICTTWFIFETTSNDTCLFANCVKNTPTGQQPSVSVPSSSLCCRFL